MAAELARTTGAVVLLKGHRTLVATPAGDIFINPTGNAGMATAGSGDVLTGVVAGLLAQGLEPWEAAVLGAHAHGLAGDLAAAETGLAGLVASDILAHLPRALTQIVTPETESA